LSATARRTLLGVALLGVLGGSAAQTPEEVLIDTVPDSYRLSPEREGVTGPLTAERFAELGAGEADPELNESLEGYLRFWSDRRGGGIVAIAARGRDGDQGAAILRGALGRVRQDAMEPFAVPEVRDAQGFTSRVDQAGGEVVVHSVVFRRGPWAFVLSASAPPPGPPRELVRDLAITQDGRAPDGPSSTEEGFEGFATALGEVALGVALVALLAGGLTLLVRQRRASGAHPHPGSGEPSVRPPSQPV